jgi:hypothetical protein
MIYAGIWGIEQIVYLQSKYAYQKYDEV